MSKLVKFLLIFFIMLSISICINFSYAIDLNLTEQTNLIDSPNISTNVFENPMANTTSNFANSTIDETSSTHVSTVNGLPEANLGLSNILNIFVIAIGIILILLGIAILLKK